MTSQNLFLAAAILSSSFWGSWHCAAMCGPVASIAAQKRSLWLYHLGRLLSYGLVGALGGHLGSFFLGNDIDEVRIYSGIIFAALLLWFGLQTFRGKLNVFSPNFKWLHKLYRPQTPALLLGLLSVLLPCGWLYSYLIAAATTQTAINGALVMTVFWLGGLPALSSVSLLIGKTINIAPEQKQKIASVVMILGALYTLGSLYYTPTHCHH